MEVMCEEQRDTSSKDPLLLSSQRTTLKAVEGYEIEAEALVFRTA